MEGGITVDPTDVDVGVFTKRGAEVSVEEDVKESKEEFDVNSDSDDEFDVHIWKESEEELSIDNEGYAVEDDLFKVRIKENEVGRVRS